MAVGTRRRSAAMSPVTRSYYGELFGWEFDTSGPVSSAVAEAGNDGFVAGDGAGINGDVRGGPDYTGHVTFYVGVPDVEAALHEAERLGGTRTMGPDRAAGTNLVAVTSPTPRAT